MRRCRRGRETAADRFGPRAHPSGPSFACSGQHPLHLLSAFLSVHCFPLSTATANSVDTKRNSGTRSPPLFLSLALRCRRVRTAVAAAAAAAVMCSWIAIAARPLSHRRSMRRPSTRAWRTARRARRQQRPRPPRGSHSSLQPPPRRPIIQRTKRHAGRSNSTCNDSTSSSNNSNSSPSTRPSRPNITQQQQQHRQPLRAIQLLSPRCLPPPWPSIPCACSNGCSNRTQLLQRG